MPSEPVTLAGAYVGPMTECDACFEAAWFAELDADPDAPAGVITTRADDARAAGLHPCSNHR